MARREPSAKLSEDCRCDCGYYAFISGPAEIKQGKTATYKSNVKKWSNAGCTTEKEDCEHEETKWYLTPLGGVSLANKTKKSVEVKATATASRTSTFLKATPKGFCICKGTEEKKTCREYESKVTITIVQ